MTITVPDNWLGNPEIPTSTRILLYYAGIPDWSSRTCSSIAAALSMEHESFRQLRRKLLQRGLLEQRNRPEANRSIISEYRITTK